MRNKPICYVLREIPEIYSGVPTLGLPKIKLKKN